MRLSMRSIAMRLKRGRTVAIRGGAGNVLRVDEGSVWVTEEDSPHDVVLRAGERLRLARNGLAVVEAFSDASLAFDPMS